jgi:DNA-binding transcriptional regulator YbjK
MNKESEKKSKTKCAAPGLPPQAAASPRRQARGEARRRQVLEATLRLLAHKGPRAVTHRAVAREAGTSLRATTYYFGSRDELLVEALRHYAATALERLDALAESLPLLPDTPVEPTPERLRAAAEILADTVLSDLAADRTGLVAEYELVLETSRQPALEADYRQWQQRLEEILAAYARAFGSSDPALDARLALATLRGLELEALARPSSPPTRGELTAVFLRLLHGMAAADHNKGTVRSF